MTRMFMPPLGTGARHQPVFERQVEAQIRRRLERDPYTVPAEVWDLIRAEGGEAADLDAAVRTETGTPAALAGIASDRVPGLRDPVTADHPIHRQLIEGDDAVALSGHTEGDWPAHPVGAAEIRRAALRRWRSLTARGADLDRLYAGDPAYDADHGSDELMQRALDIDLRGLIDLLIDLEAVDPALLAAAWRRDVETFERLLKRHRNRLPMVAGLTAVRDASEQIMSALTIFWELERGFEMLRAASGTTRRTHLTLGAALASSTALTAGFAANSRDGRYLVDGWMQFLPLRELVEVGPGAHPAASPWLAYGPGGDPAAVDHHAGLGSAAGHATLARAHSVVAPFVRHHAHRQVQEVAPSSFVWGRDPLALAITIPLQIASTLPTRIGRWKDRRSEFVPEHYGAFGRLAMLMLGNLCPDTAWAALIASIAAPGSGSDADPMEVPAYGPPALGDVVANPEGWHALKAEGDRPWASPREQRSIALGPCAFDNMTRSVKASLRVMPSDPSEAGYELGFHPPTWRSGFDPRPNLRTTVEHVPMGYRQRLPACYRHHSKPVFEFCISRAAELRPGYTPDAQDPAYLYGLSPTFAAAQFGGCGRTIRSAVLAARADEVVELARARIVPALAPPSDTILRRRRARKNGSKSAGGKR